MPPSVNFATTSRVSFSRFHQTPTVSRALSTTNRYLPSRRPTPRASPSLSSARTRPPLLLATVCSRVTSILSPDGLRLVRRELSRSEFRSLPSRFPDDASVDARSTTTTRRRRCVEDDYSSSSSSERSVSKPGGRFCWC